MKVRYQVIIEKAHPLYDKKSYDFETKSKANAFAKAVRDQGGKCSIWDCYNNPLSNMFRL